MLVREDSFCNRQQAMQRLITSQSANYEAPTSTYYHLKTGFFIEQEQEECESWRTEMRIMKG